MIKYKVGHGQVKARVTQNGTAQAPGPLFEIEENPTNTKRTNHPKQGGHRLKNPSGTRIKDTKMCKMGKCKSGAVYDRRPSLTEFFLKTPVDETPVHHLFSYWAENHANTGIYRKVYQSILTQIRWK